MNSLITKIEKDLDSMDADMPTKVESWEKQSIYRVPASVIDLNEKAYKPQIVSLGPYHHGEDHLKAMDEHKLRALLFFSRRSGRPIELYVDALARVVDDLKGAYDQLGPEWLEKKDEAFVKLMILDGCFILEILRTATHTLNDKDPIFSTHGKINKVPYLRRDMLMLENQLPLLVLERLVAVEEGIYFERAKNIVNDRILKFFSLKPVRNAGQCLHILDVYRKSLLGEDNEDAIIPVNSQPGEDDIIASAAELSDAGIVFRKSDTKRLKDISFRDGFLKLPEKFQIINLFGGVLKLPEIVVDGNTESVYLNLIAFERLHVGAGNEVTSYIFFMDSIINSARDVRLLQLSGIIQSEIGSYEAVANVFKSLSKVVTPDPESELGLGEVRKKVSFYYKKSLIVYILEWARQGFVPLLLTIYGLLFTIIQTVYGILSYRKSRSE